MEDLYLEHILDHFSHPRNKEPFEQFSAQAPTCTLHNHGCGDHIVVSAERDTSGRISLIRWDGNGCAISQASASILSDFLPGKSVEEVLGWGKKEVEEQIGVALSLTREKCGLLFLRALQRFFRENA